MRLKYISKCSALVVWLYCANAAAAMHDLKTTTITGTAGFNGAPSGSLLGVGVNYFPFNHWLSLGGAFEYAQSFSFIEMKGDRFQPITLRLLPEVTVQYGYPWIVSAGLGAGPQLNVRSHLSGSKDTKSVSKYPNDSSWAFAVRPKMAIEYMLNASISLGVVATGAIPLRRDLPMEYGASLMFSFYKF